MAIMDDTPERLEIVKKLSDIVDEDVPMIFTINKQYYTVIQPWARRTHQNQMMEGGVKYLAIDAAMRERVIGSWNRKPLWLLVLAGAVLVAAAAHALRWNRRRDA
jgi:hypothetical protein